MFVYLTNLPTCYKIKSQLKLQAGNNLSIMMDGIGITYPLNVRVLKIQDEKITLEPIMFIPVNEYKD